MTTLGEVRAQEDWARLKAASGATRHSSTVENADSRIGRLERLVIDEMMSTNIRHHDGLIIALQQRVDLLTRALAKYGIVGEELFENRPMADSCPWSCDPGTGCPDCERQPELYCWRCDAAETAT
jgi:hypothetical protein